MSSQRRAVSNDSTESLDSEIRALEEKIKLLEQKAESYAKAALSLGIDPNTVMNKPFSWAAAQNAESPRLVGQAAESSVRFEDVQTDDLDATRPRIMNEIKRKRSDSVETIQNDDDMNDGSEAIPQFDRAIASGGRPAKSIRRMQIGKAKNPDGSNKQVPRLILKLNGPAIKNAVQRIENVDSIESDTDSSTSANDEVMEDGSGIIPQFDGAIASGGRPARPARRMQIGKAKNPDGSNKQVPRLILKLNGPAIKNAVQMIENVDRMGSDSDSSTSTIRPQPADHWGLDTVLSDDEDPEELYATPEQEAARRLLRDLKRSQQHDERELREDPFLSFKTKKFGPTKSESDSENKDDSSKKLGALRRREEREGTGHYGRVTKSIVADIMSSPMMRTKGNRPEKVEDLPVTGRELLSSFGHLMSDRQREELCKRSGITLVNQKDIPLGHGLAETAHDIDRDAEMTPTNTIRAKKVQDPSRPTVREEPETPTKSKRSQQGPPKPLKSILKKTVPADDAPETPSTPTGSHKPEASTKQNVVLEKFKIKSQSCISPSVSPHAEAQSTPETSHTAEAPKQPQSVLEGVSTTPKKFRIKSKRSDSSSVSDGPETSPTPTASQTPEAQTTPKLPLRGASRIPKRFRLKSPFSDPPLTPLTPVTPKEPETAVKAKANPPVPPRKPVRSEGKKVSFSDSPLAPPKAKITQEPSTPSKKRSPVPSAWKKPRKTSQGWVVGKSAALAPVLSLSIQRSPPEAAVAVESGGREQVNDHFSQNPNPFAFSQTIRGVDSTTRRGSVIHRPEWRQTDAEVLQEPVAAAMAERSQGVVAGPEGIQPVEESRSEVEQEARNRRMDSGPTCGDEAGENVSGAGVEEQESGPASSLPAWFLAVRRSRGRRSNSKLSKPNNTDDDQDRTIRDPNRPIRNLDGTIRHPNHNICDPDRTIRDPNRTIRHLDRTIRDPQRTIRATMNNFPSFLDTANTPMANAVPRQSPSPGGASHQTNGSGSMPNLVNGLLSGGHQTDINHLWSVVQELSSVLSENRQQTAGIVNQVQQLQQSRDATSPLGSQQLNGDNGAAAAAVRQSATELLALRTQLHSTQAQLAASETQTAGLRTLIQDYETSLTSILEKLRPYAYRQHDAILALHAHYNGLLDKERQQNLELRLEYQEWQQGLGRVAQYARAALKESNEGTLPHETKIKQLKAENKLLRRLAGWEEAPDSDDEEDRKDEESQIS